MKKVVEQLLMAGAVIFIFFSFMKYIVAPLAPVFTILFVAGFTVAAMSRRLTALLTISGLALYAFSWFIVEPWGPFWGFVFGAAGMIAWFAGSFLFLEGWISKFILKVKEGLPATP